MADSSTIFLGIDPGKTGAIAILAPTFTEAIDTPLDEATGDIDPDEMSRIVGGACSFRRPVVCAIERAQSMPQQSCVSTFTYGMGYGLWLGVLAAHRVSVFLRVRPHDWKKKMLPVGANLKDKMVSIRAARELFPNVDLGKRSDGGRAEALLVAEFGRREYGRF
jgi:hypothetical protein